MPKDKSNHVICKEKVKKFVEKNQAFLKHKVVQSFLNNEINNKLFLEVVCDPTPRKQRILDEEFKKFYFNIRFTAFISSTLYFNAINYDKRNRKNKNRYQLTLDKPIGEGEEYSFKDLIEDPNTPIDLDNFLKSSNIQEYIQDPLLFKAIEQLTKKQKEVIDLAYVKCLSDTEIGLLLDKSQQAISKLHKKALEKIFNFIQENGDGLDDSS
ncbi:sigma-70 family RNA polymerase sigma factor [Virgibacillus halodenitrificans]|uniref:sigma-70 family RNA polymerase sigma factor n=1 Tax=Virgibacillus halodenitrificans TaxID=1482 RepID=UPI0013CECB40|nr:sigma-70 family RNA polymerase sigma factor [Virgibacillus halodenitrificans]